MTDQNTRRRVKLYALNAERQWDDRGTGHVTSSYVEKLQGVSLLVKAEIDGNILLESKIQPETIYQKQQETLIVWSEGDNFDLALSFQERAGCDEIWEKICQVQGRDPSVEITQEVVEESEDERFDDMSDTVPSIELPAAEMGRLEEISELINSCLHSAIKREKLTLAVEADNYIPKLMRMFQMCEDLENTAGLHHLHDIIINLFQLNKNALIESMFKIDVIFDVVGCLEYDPANPVPTRHREYLRQMANFKQVLPIRNSELLAKIHQTYRVQYIQDIVLPTPNMFEDNVLSTLTSFIFFNKLDIVRQLQDDEKFLTEFFALLSDEKTAITKRRDLVLFLKEFCTFSHNLQAQSKETFFKTLLSLGVLQALETTLTVDAGDLSQPGQVIKAACIDILMYIVEAVPSMVREHMLQQAESCDDDQLLMNLIVEQMVCDRDPEGGLAVPLSGIIRILIDPDNMMAALNRSEKTEFFGFFYKHCMHSLVAPLLSNTTDASPLHDDPATVQLLNLVLELLSFCVEHHTFHAKNFIITRNMVARILVLMKSKHKYLVLDALRFLRKMVALKDENYNRHIVKQNLFAPVVEAFFHNQGRYNLLDSAVIELFEFIKTEDIKTLLAYIVETFGDKLLDVTYVQTFRNLKQRYEQQQDRLQQRTTALESVPSILRGTNRYRRDPRQLDEDEEMWFNDDDDYEDAVEPPPEHSLASAVAVSDLEQIGKIIEGRGKFFPSSPTAAMAELAGDKEPVGASGVAASAEPAANKLPLAETQTAAISMVKKVGLVDYDADSDEEDDDGCEEGQMTSLSLQLSASVSGQPTPPAAAHQLVGSPSQQTTPPGPASSAGSPGEEQLEGSPGQPVLGGSHSQLQSSGSASQTKLAGAPSQAPVGGSVSQSQIGCSPVHLSASVTRRTGSPGREIATSPDKLATLVQHSSPDGRQANASGDRQETSPALPTSPTSPTNRLAASPTQQPTASPVKNLANSPVQHLATSPVQHLATSPVQRLTTSPVQRLTTSPVQHPSASPSHLKTTPSQRLATSPTQQVAPAPQEREAAPNQKEAESAMARDSSAGQPQSMSPVRKETDSPIDEEAYSPATKEADAPAHTEGSASISKEENALAHKDVDVSIHKDGDASVDNDVDLSVDEGVDALAQQDMPPVEQVKPSPAHHEEGSPVRQKAASPTAADSVSVERELTSAAGHDEASADQTSSPGDQPVQSGPAGQPVQSGPAGQQPVQSEPAGQQPVQSEPAGQQPVQSGPAGQQPVQSGPAGQQPVQSGPAGQQPVQSGPAGQQPVQSGPAGQQPVQSGPAGQQPVQSGAAGQQPCPPHQANSPPANSPPPTTAADGGYAPARRCNEDDGELPCAKRARLDPA